MDPIDGMEIIRLLGAVVASSAFGAIATAWLNNRKELEKAKLDQQPHFISTLLKRIENLEDDRKRLDGTADRLTQELHETDKARALLERELGDLRREHEALRVEAGKLSERNAQLEVDHAQLKRHVEKLETENKRLRREREETTKGPALAAVPGKGHE